MTSIKTLILAALLVTPLQAQEWSVVSRVRWTTWRDAAVSRQPTVVLLIDPRTCPSCVIVERDCLTDVHVARRLNRLNPVKVTGNLVRLWRVSGVPHIILVDRKWKVVRRDPCPTSPVEMIILLELYERLSK